MFLDHLAADEWRALRKVGDVLEVPKGVAFLRATDAGDCFFLIERGRAEVQLHGYGEELIAATLGPGELVGEFAFLGMRSRSANVVATQDCRLIRFHCADVERISERIPSAGMKIYRGMARELVRRLVAENEKMVELSVWKSLSRSRRCYAAAKEEQPA